MRLPGTRYQEHGWEQVRKLLGQCSVQVLPLLDGAKPLDAYVEAMTRSLRAQARSARAMADGNSYGDSVLELAHMLLLELQERPADWAACCTALDAGEASEAGLRKKFNDMYALLRDRVDADNYQVACGRPCSANKIYTYRMLDTARGEIMRIFDGWESHREQVGAILGRSIEATPIEIRQPRCRAEWVINWSASLERFGGSPGPLHTRSKRFASLKNNPDRIANLLQEIIDYEELSANHDSDWANDSKDATEWLDDLWRVLAEAEPATLDEHDAASEPEPDPYERGDDDHAADSAPEPRLEAIAESLSLPPRYLELAGRAQDRASWTAKTLAQHSLPVRLAVYQKLLGSTDDCYPEDWLDPATGELPTMQQLAALDEVSLPTLRKRRDLAIAALNQAARP